MSPQRAARSASAGRRPADTGRTAQSAAMPGNAPHCQNPNGFTWFAHETARLTGRPAAFIVASGIIVAWAVSGPLFHYSDTWQLVINTGTTIVTFLMVFLIQNTQNRDTMALQIKLAELIIAVHGARNRIAAAEDMSDADLETMHAAYRRRADETLDSLKQRRASRGSG